MPSDLSTPPGILFVDDDADIRQAAGLLLSRHGFRLHGAAGPDAAWSVLAAEPIEAVLLDLNFDRGATTGAEGLAWLGKLIAHDPDAVVIVVTGHSGINIAVAAMRAGATDFLMKPWRNDRLVATLQDAVALRRRRRVAPAGDAAAGQDLHDPLVGESGAFRQVLAVLHRAASTEAPVLLSGEAGTGKTLLAQAIHAQSPHRHARLATLDVAAAWAEGEAGLAAALAAAAPGGTLLLEEIVALPVAGQALLAGALPAGMRLLATTRQPPEALRETVQPDLLHRLNTVELALPPLRARAGDVALLAEHFVRLFGRRYGRAELSLSADALDALSAHRWPGNVRALRLAVERAAVLAPHDVLTAADIPLAVPAAADVATPAPGSGDLNLARSERAIVEAALRRHGFNVSHAARELGLTRAALYRRMARHGL